MGQGVRVLAIDGFRGRLGWVSFPEGRSGAGELQIVPLFPLPDVVFFPRMRLPLHVFEPRYRRLVSDAMRGAGLIAIPRLKPGFENEYYDCPRVFEVCGLGSIAEHRKLPDGRSNILLDGIMRVRLLEELGSEPYRVARVEELPDREGASLAELSALRHELGALVKRLGPQLPDSIETLERIVRDAPTAGQCADALSVIFVSDADERQRLLEELDPLERISRLIARMHELLELAGVGPVEPGQLN